MTVYGCDNWLLAGIFRRIIYAFIADINQIFQGIEGSCGNNGSIKIINKTDKPNIHPFLANDSKIIKLSERSNTLNRVFFS